MDEDKMGRIEDEYRVLVGRTEGKRLHGNR